MPSNKDAINKIFDAVMGSGAAPVESTPTEAPPGEPAPAEVPEEEAPEGPGPEEGPTEGTPPGDLPVGEEAGPGEPEDEEIPQEVLEVIAQLGEDPTAAAKSLVSLLKGHGDKITESLIAEIPSLVGHLVQQRVEMAMTAIEFFKAHPELEKHKGIVEMVATRLEGENPGMEKGELLGRIAEDSKLELAKIKSDGEEGPSLPTDEAPGGKVGNPPAPGNSQQDKMARLLERAGKKR